MSDKILDIENKLKEILESVDITELTRKSRLAGHVHDQVVPMINEVVVSAANSTTYEDAYKILIDRLRAMHEAIANAKLSADRLLLTSIGRVEITKELLEDIAPEADAIRDSIKKERVANIAEKIQSGSLDPDAPRKIGDRPESIKNIREAKRTLFGESKPTDDED